MDEYFIFINTILFKSSHFVNSLLTNLQRAIKYKQGVIIMTDLLQYKMIDFHVHVFGDKVAKKATVATSEHYRVPSECPDGSLDTLIKTIDGLQIEKMVVHSTATKKEQVVAINDFLNGLSDPRFVKFGTVHPDYDDIESEIIRIKNLGFKGIKLHCDFQQFNADDRAADEIYEVAQEQKMPILMHVGDGELGYSHPVRIANVATHFRDLKIIAAHMGGREQWEAGALNLRPYDNIYFDTSSTISMLGARKFDQLIDIFGVSRILFGTDFPLNDHRLELARMSYLNRTEAEFEDILYNNAAKLLEL